jgi:hypothetical protein
LVRDLLLDDKLVLGIDSDLHVVAHRNMRMRRHRSAVGVGEPDLALPRLVELGVSGFDELGQSLPL